MVWICIIKPLNFIFMRTIKTWLATIAVLLCSISASAHDFEVDGIYYNILSESDKTVEVTYKGNSSDAYSDEYYFHETIPSTVTYGGITYTVIAIGEQAFLSCKGVTGITIPNTVTSIGWRAFYYCTKLTDVTIPSSVKVIAGYAFGHCESLPTITIPENVTTIREGAFSGCSNLTKYIFNATNITSSVGVAENGQYSSGIFYDCNKLTTIIIGNNVKKIPTYAFWQSKISKITIPENVTSIGDNAFYGCTSLREVTFKAKNCTNAGSTDYPTFDGCNNLTIINIGENVETIPARVFYGCAKITSITIPNSVTSFGAAAFGKCTGLKSITLPNTLTSIAPSLFVGCTSLSGITIPNTVIEISGAAFSGCTALTDITIPSSVKKIGDGAFNGCTSIAEIVLPESINRIGGTMFSGCSGLKNITIPNTVTSIGSGAFSGCSSLTEVSIPNSVEDISNAVFKDCTSLTNVNIPNTVTRLLDLFRGCTSLKNIEIPNSVTSLSNTFYGCTNLSDIVIPSSVTSIGDCTFRSCTNLKSVTIPNSVTQIGWAAFYNCRSLSSVTIPEGIKEILSSTFSYCEALTEVICKSSIPAVVSGDAFTYTPYKTLYVPKGSKEAYANADGWKWFEDIIEYSLIPEYTITYMVDGEEYYSETIESGAEIPVIDAPAKEGYTFSGWENLPSNMPDEDITVYAKYTPNNYTVSFKANGKIIYSELLAYGTTIVTPDAPEIEDYAFVEWLDLLETVPAHDVEFVAVYKQVGVRIADGANDFTQEGNKAYDKITYTRTLPNLEWNSLFVPFEIPVSDLTDYYDVAYINDIHSYDKDFDGEIDQMEMEVIYIKEGTLHANHPYLIRAKNDEAKEMSIVVTDATLYSSAKADRISIACSSAYTDFEVIGTYEKMSAEELDGCYAISTSGAWSPIASGASLNPFRLYMTITSRDGSPVKVSESAMSRINIRVQGEDTETGITETENGKVKTESFDLSGRRVERMQKGIYIVNGKKVVRQLETYYKRVGAQRAASAQNINYLGTMKRKYIQPQTMAIRVAVEKIMASSDRIPIENTPGVPAARDYWNY